MGVGGGWWAGRGYLLISLPAKISHLDIAQTVINGIDLCVSDWRPGEQMKSTVMTPSPGDGKRLPEMMAVSHGKALLLPADILDDWIEGNIDTDVITLRT